MDLNKGIDIVQIMIYNSVKCGGGIDNLRLIRELVKLNGDRVRWKDPLLLNGNSRRLVL